jgi:pentatricopeptide repeat protein
MLAHLGRLDESIGVRQAAYALAPELPTTGNNLFTGYLRAGRLDEAEKLLDQARSSDFAEAPRDSIGDTIWKAQRFRRGLIRVLRDPAQLEAVREELDDQDNARLRDALARLGTTPEDIDRQFQIFEEKLDLHVDGVDTVGFLRNVRYAAYRKDPRYIRLLNKAGFDDEGNIR